MRFGYKHPRAVSDPQVSEAVNRFQLLMLGFDSQQIDNMYISDIQLIGALYPLHYEREFERDAGAVNKGMFGGR